MILCSDAAVKKTTKKRKRDEETFQRSKRSKQIAEIKFSDRTYSVDYRVLFRYKSVFKQKFPHKPPTIVINRESNNFASVLTYLQCPSRFDVKAKNDEYLELVRQEAELYEIEMLHAKVNAEILHRKYPKIILVQLASGYSPGGTWMDVGVQKMAEPLTGVYKMTDMPGDDDRPSYEKENADRQWLYYEEGKWCFDTTLTDDHPEKKKVDILPLDHFGNIMVYSNPTDAHLTFNNLEDFQKLQWSGSLENAETEKVIAQLSNLRFKFIPIDSEENIKMMTRTLEHGFDQVNF